MPTVYRDIYLSAAAEATAAYLSTFQPGPSRTGVAQINLNVPQLNPELDIYDRRFLLQLTWAVIDVTAASCRLRTRVLVQGARAFGAIPLSIAGLRRNLDADVELSRDAWPEQMIRTGDLEDPNDLADDDQIIVVISPTNAVSMPVINSMIQMVERARGRPVIILNPRLGDVPSHSGVMQVAGRADRIRFLECITDIFYLRLLFKPGTNFPLRGILFRSFPGPWQLWLPEDSDTKYSLVLTAPNRPSSSEITSALKAYKYTRQKEMLKHAEASGSVTTIESLLTSPFSIAIVVLCAVLGFASLPGVHIRDLIMKTMTGFPQ